MKGQKRFELYQRMSSNLPFCKQVHPNLPRRRHKAHFYNMLGVEGQTVHGLGEPVGYPLCPPIHLPEFGCIPTVSSERWAAATRSGEGRPQALRNDPPDRS